MNILIVKLSAIGDVVHTLPALAALRKRFPDAHITWVIEEAASDLIMDHPLLDCVIISRRKSWIDDLKAGRKRNFISIIGKVLKDMRLLRSELRKRHYDLVVDFHGLLKSALIVFLSGGARKLGYDSLQELSGLFYNEKIPEDLSKHAVDRYLDFARYLGANLEKPEFIIPIRDENENRVKALLEANGIGPGSPFVAVSPQALWATKLWSDQRFAQLGERIVRELNVPVVLTGAGEESAKGIQSYMTLPSINMTGRTTLRDLACLFREASLLITTDSGPMHVAAAVGKPVVALFGPTDPKRTGPYGEAHIVIQKDVPCSPCFLKTCETRHCMREIMVEDVFRAVRKIIKETGNMSGRTIKEGQDDNQ